MQKPRGLRTLDLAQAEPARDANAGVSLGAVEPAAESTAVRCTMAQCAYNSAHRGKVAYQALVFILAIAVVVSAIWAITAFKDEDQAQGFLALVAAVGSFGTSGILGTLAKSASDDEDEMWKRVEKYCE